MATASKKNSDEISQRLMTRQETADFLRISLRTLDDMAAAGEIQPTRVRSRVLYRREDVEEYLERQRAEA